MLVLLLALTLISILALLVGFSWIVATSGEAHQATGEDVGAQIIGEQFSDDDSSVVQKTGFKGSAISFGRESSISFTEIRARLSAGHYCDFTTANEAPNQNRRKRPSL